MSENSRVLIVEDESIVALDIQSCLQASGYQVAGVVDSGEKAIELAQKDPLDLVLMDIHLKGKMDGIEAAAVLHTQHNLPVIFLTAFADEETLRRSQASAAYGYLLKPFDENSLKPTIETVLSRHRLERELRESEERYKRLVETLPDSVFVTDLDLKIQFCNQRAVKMYAFASQQDLIGKSALDFLAPEQHEVLVTKSKTLMETGDMGTSELSLLRSGGEAFPGEVSASIMLDALGNTKGFIAISRDITERKRLEKQTHDLLEQVQNLARRDPLTGLYNHRYLLELAEAEFQRSARYQHPLAVIFIDIDHFKNVNDRFGHLVGDLTLQVVSQFLGSNLRNVDLIGRFGGEEFLALLSEATAAEAQRIAQRLRDELDQKPLTIDAHSIQITASFGVADNLANPVDLNLLIQWADIALYEAKRKGRNRVEVYEPG